MIILIFLYIDHQYSQHFITISIFCNIIIKAAIYQLSIFNQLLSFICENVSLMLIKLTNIKHPMYHNIFINFVKLCIIIVGLYVSSNISLFLLNQQLSKLHFIANPTSDFNESPKVR